MLATVMQLGLGCLTRSFLFIQLWDAHVYQIAPESVAGDVVKGREGTHHVC